MLHGAQGILASFAWIPWWHPHSCHPRPSHLIPSHCLLADWIHHWVPAPIRSGTHSLPRPFQMGSFPDHCFFSGIHHFSGWCWRFQSKPTECELWVIFHCFASLTVRPHLSLKCFGWKHMPKGQSSCCLALCSIHTSKPGASLGPGDHLWEAGQNTIKVLPLRWLLQYEAWVKSQKTRGQPSNLVSVGRGRRTFKDKL